VSSPIWCSWPDIYYSLTVTVLFLWGALSDERTGLSFVYAAGPRQHSLSRVRVPCNSWPYFTVSRFETSLFVCPKPKVKVMLRPTVQSASLSWNKAPIWGLWPDLYYCQTVAGLLMWSALSDESTSLSFARLSQQYYVSYQYVQFTCYKSLNVCIYNIYKASVSSGSVQQIMPYR
jgi:hypothetical protein